MKPPPFVASDFDLALREATPLAIDLDQTEVVLNAHEIFRLRHQRCMHSLKPGELATIERIGRWRGPRLVPGSGFPETISDLYAPHVITAADVERSGLMSDRTTAYVITADDVAKSGAALVDSSFILNELMQIKLRPEDAHLVSMNDEDRASMLAWLKSEHKEHVE